MSPAKHAIAGPIGVRTLVFSLLPMHSKIPEEQCPADIWPDGLYRDLCARCKQALQREVLSHKWLTNPVTACVQEVCRSCYTALTRDPNAHWCVGCSRERTSTQWATIGNKKLCSTCNAFVTRREKEGLDVDTIRRLLVSRQLRKPTKGRFLPTKFQGLGQMTDPKELKKEATDMVNSIVAQMQHIKAIPGAQIFIITQNIQNPRDVHIISTPLFEPLRRNTDLSTLFDGALNHHSSYSGSKEIRGSIALACHPPPAKGGVNTSSIPHMDEGDEAITSDYNTEQHEDDDIAAARLTDPMGEDEDEDEDDDASPPRRLSRIDVHDDDDASPPRRLSPMEEDDDDDASPPRRLSRIDVDDDDDEASMSERNTTEESGGDDEASMSERNTTEESGGDDEASVSERDKAGDYETSMSERDTTEEDDDVTADDVDDEAFDRMDDDERMEEGSDLEAVVASSVAEEQYLHLSPVIMEPAPVARPEHEDNDSDAERLVFKARQIEALAKLDLEIDSYPLPEM
ncbi:hypothetical protein M408DRAFT_96256 [Serendipita vermifera MAFF 305830]|uniref:Uncharacterized protein n=1 Tax=Serendipita vermifera MAFF 305830 TaxID=933852 RepID=A0A0C3BST6_SERVB|nr:hypothetical protein M408DRAFT_96256 [Serendipita vermifera MAFF 305830]